MTVINCEQSAAVHLLFPMHMTMTADRNLITTFASPRSLILASFQLNFKWVLYCINWIFISDRDKWYCYGRAMYCCVELGQFVRVNHLATSRIHAASRPTKHPANDCYIISTEYRIDWKKHKLFSLNLFILQFCIWKIISN